MIEDFKEVHGDKYDYSKVEYINNITKVIITCSEHGEFKQSPSAHKQGAGCPTCNHGWNKERLLISLIILVIKIY